jgi:hypothetical protein
VAAVVAAELLREQGAVAGAEVVVLVQAEPILVERQERLATISRMTLPRSASDGAQPRKMAEGSHRWSMRPAPTISNRLKFCSPPERM